MSAFYVVMSDEGDTNHFVVELPLNLIMNRFTKLDDAMKLCKHLNTGYGFQGMTPPFFARKVIRKKINE